MDLINEKNILKILTSTKKKIEKIAGNAKNFKFWGCIKTPYGDVIGCGIKLYGDKKAIDFVKKVTKL